MGSSGFSKVLRGNGKFNTYMVLSGNKYTQIMNMIYYDKYDKQSKLCIIFRNSINSNSLISYV